MADEVYQTNTYLPDSKFFSFKKVLMDLGSPFNQMEMGRNLSSRILSSYFLFFI